MIKVDRTAKPAVLTANENKWLAEYQNALAQYQANHNITNKKAKDKAEGKYNHKLIKAELKDMFLGKCAYCESHILHIDHGDIEHFYPKFKYPDLCFSWDNLLLACGVCNDKAHKGDKFPSASEGGPFVNPVEEDPENFFEFEFDPNTGTANVIPKNSRGLTTEIILGLNRTDLVKHRSSIVKKMALVAIKAGMGDQDCLDEILNCCAKEDEYSAFAKALVKRFKLV